MLKVHGRPGHVHKEVVEDADGNKEKIKIQLDKLGFYETEDPKEIKILRKHHGHKDFWRIKKDTEEDDLYNLNRSMLHAKAKKLGWEYPYRKSTKNGMINFIVGSQ